MPANALGEVEWRFLILLGIGILLASVALAAVIERLLEDHPAETAALFFGLVLGSILIAWRLITTPTPCATQSLPPWRSQPSCSSV